MNLVIPFESLSRPLAIPRYEVISAESGKMLGMIEDAVNHLLETSVEHQRLDDAVAVLNDVYQECCESNWDGYGAQAITEEAYQEAFKLLTLLPSNVLMPEVVPEPTGAIGLEWSRGRRFVFVASVCGENFITYAGLFGVNRIHGSECFGDSLPLVIIENIRRLYAPQAS
jgi:hypothetical protein